MTAPAAHPGSPGAGSHQERLLRVLVHIDRHLDDDLSLEALASVASFSPYHFHRIFRASVGESVAAYVRRLRLERAARQLVHSTVPVAQVAAASGYDARESFTRAFRQRYGRPPLAFREELRSRGSADDAPQAEAASRLAGPAGRSRLNVGITTIAPIRVVFLRHVGDYARVGPTWVRLWAWTGQRGLLHPGSRWIGVSYDDPDVSPAARLRYDACLAVGDAEVEPAGEFGVQTLRGGAYAAFEHRGAFDRIPESYDAFFGSWLPDSGRRCADAPCLNEHVNFLVPPPLLRTRICVPLEADS